jgi:integrase
MRERHTGRIFQRGNVWWIQYYFHGQQIRTSAGEGKTENDAKKLLKRKLAQVETNTHTDSRNIRYEDLRQAYYQDYAVNERKSLRHDKDGDPRIDKVVRLDGFFEGYRAAEIDADLIRKFIADQKEKGRANGTINRSVSALRRMFNLAKQDGRLTSMPYFPMSKESRPRQGFFEGPQYDALMAVLPDYLRLPFSIGYFSGMREGEILGLKWEQEDDKGVPWKQVDFLAGVIRLDDTKNDDARVVPIIPQLRTLLVEQHTKLAKLQENCPWVCFRMDKKGHPVRVRSFRKAWYSACAKAQLGKLVPKIDRVTGSPVYAKPRTERAEAKAKMIWQGSIFHDLRRTGVRNLIDAGVSEKVAMMISGHLTRSVFERYNIRGRKDVAEAGKKLELFHSQNGDKTGTALHQDTAASSVPN